MIIQKKLIIENIKGFLDPDEGELLYRIAIKASRIGPCLEIGSYCGKSAAYIGSACKQESSVLFSIDHHHGSEEQQLGEEYFDSNLFDYNLSMVNTLNVFIENIVKVNLEDIIIPIVSSSSIVAKTWKTKLGMVFIDGSHSYNNVLNDYTCWSKYILPSGYLVFHDIFKDPKQGGQGPYKVYKLALRTGNFIEEKMVKTLAILKRRNYNL